MNNLFLVFLYVLGMVFIPNIAFCDVKPPIGYTLEEISDFDSRIYKNSSGTVFVVVVDTSKSNSHVNFGGRSLSQTRKYYYTVNGKSYLATRIMYTKQSVVNWYIQKYNNSSLNPPLSAFAVINAQFFGCPISYDVYLQNPSSAYCALSFPVRSSGSNGVNQIVSDNVDTTDAKRTVLIRTNGDTYIVDGYDQRNLTAYDTKELLVGLKNTLNPTNSIGRTYIGGIPYSGCNLDAINTCKMQYLLFFVAKSEYGDSFDKNGNLISDSTHSTMTKKIAEWGISRKTMVAMDGSGSSQLKSKTINFAGSDPNRSVPSVIVIK